MHYPLMSIILLNWNGLEDTKICLEHIQRIDYPNYEVIVVDNGSAADQKAYLSKVPDIIYVDNPMNRGFTGGHIDGLAKASGEFIVILNNDAVIKNDYLTQALKAFADPKVAAVGGRSYFWNDSNPILDEANEYYAFQNVNPRTGEAFMQQTDYNVPQEVNNISGSAAVIRRSVIDELGYLYDPFFAYFEETDLFARYKRAGYKVIYDPALRIWHRNGASSGASSGSHFFYYQIFRNRFIFALRNFETKALWPFIRTYGHIAFGATARRVLRPNSPNKVMNRAYSMAAWRNLRTLATTLATRRQLQSQLGPSRYNHQLFIEQTGISIVIDGTGQTPQKIEKLIASLPADPNPLHEYLIVISGGQLSPDFRAKQPNVRVVTDRGYFGTNPLNLGCLAARFDWVVLCTPQHLPPPASLDQAVAATYGTSYTMVGFGRSGAANPVVVLHKNLYTGMGGLDQRAAHTSLLAHLLSYAERSKTLLWQPALPAGKTFTYPTPDNDTLRELDKRLRRDHAYLHAQDVTRWGKLKQRYSRLHQIAQLIHWLFMPQLTLYLKAARIKNLLLFSATLNRPKLALELKHIRNEVVLNTASGIDVSVQQKIIKQQLSHLKSNPTDVPVFIICRDRVDSLKVLVDWLEKHGLTKITFIDNDSVYPPLVEYLRHTPYQVLRLYRNVGHTSPWKLGLIRALVPEQFYIVSDPDVIPDKECPQDILEYFRSLHEQFLAYQKVGFGLRIDDLPDHYPLKQSVIDWEGQFWTKELAPGVYEAGVDTTFAMYKPFSYAYTLHPSIRTGHPYVARHEPWYANPKHISDEEKHYRMRADRNVSSWNVDVLEERYEKELAKNKKKK